MNVKYMGASSALNFVLAGEVVRLEPKKAVKLTDEQVKALKDNAYAAKLIESKDLVLTSTATAKPTADATKTDTGAK